MPNTSSANWPDLTQGTKANATDVEAKFDFSEHNLWPHSSGTKADNTYYLGDTDASWIGVYTHSLDPLGLLGVALGTTTVANASDVALEVSGARAIYMPRLSTTQRDALTGRDGFIIYNTTSAKGQIFENGGWQDMAGAKIGIVAKLQASVATTALANVVNFSGSGRIRGIHFVSAASGTSQLTVDSITSTVAVASTDASWALDNRIATTGTFYASVTADFAEIDTFFKTSFLLEHGGNGGVNTITSHVLYEAN